MKVYKIIFNLIFFSIVSQGQNLISFPDTISGSVINLSIRDSTKQFFSSYNTKTIAYNGRYLGPTIFLNKGQNITLNVTNNLVDTTTTHWHGMHVSPNNDGSPHTMIMAGATWSPSFNVLDNACTNWYHPHLHGKTMSQVLKGAAGLIIVRDSIERSLLLPRKYGIDDFPLVCQFQTFDTITKEIKIDDEFDNFSMVNGTIKPLLNVPAQVVRLRILNASSHRVLQFGFNDGRTFYQITTDEGLLDAPVPLTRLRLGSGERAEILVNFSGQLGQIFYINQYGNELPSGYPGGPAMMNSPLGPLDNIAFNFLQINVVAQTASPITTIPASLTTNQITSQNGAGTRTFLIQGSPNNSMTNFVINGVKYNENVINFTTKIDSSMIWQITNQSMMAHPWHIHGNHFYILTINGVAPPANMAGRKDVVIIPPQGGVVRLIMKYKDFADSTMPYMYHCHILSHEDKGMMGQFVVKNKSQTTVGLGNSTLIVETLKLYPNPASDEINIVLTDFSNLNSTSLNIYNVLGSLVYSVDKIVTGSTVINAAVFCKGVYTVELKSSSQFLTKKLIIE